MGDTYGNSMIVDPWGKVLDWLAERKEGYVIADLDLAAQDDVRKLPSSASPSRVGVRVAPGGAGLMAGRTGNGGVDKRRGDPGRGDPRVRARRGFHACRVSDVADEAGVAYGLVYHYFDSKEEILNDALPRALAAHARRDRGDRQVDDATAREKLYMVASFIIDSYRHEPDLMKVIIVEDAPAVSFGRQHLETIRQAYALIGDIVEQARQDGSFKSDISSEFAAMCFYGAIEQLLSGWIFGILPETEEEFERAKALVVETICGGLEAAPATVSG